MVDTGEARRPVFVGGSSRSGTHPVAHLIAQSGLYHLIPRELAFHAVPAGLVGYIKGRFDRDELIEKLPRRWWRVGAGVGFDGLVTREQLDAALAGFAAAPDDRVSSSRAFIESLLDPLARAAGKPSWVEKSTQTVVAAPVLLEMFPDAAIVHLVRDGRDVACSIARMPWGPDSVPEALEYWADRLRRAEAGAREAPPGSILVIHLEDLVLLDRERSYERLLEHLRIESEPRMLSFFEEELTPERAHLGRWQAGLGTEEREATTAAYRAVLRQLHDEGVACAPPERSLEMSPESGEQTVSPLDPWSRISMGQEP